MDLFEVLYSEIYQFSMMKSAKDDLELSVE